MFLMIPIGGGSLPPNNFFLGGGGGEGESSPRFGTEKQMDAFNNTCEVGDFRVHLPSDDSRTTVTDALLEVVYGH